MTRPKRSSWPASAYNDYRTLDQSATERGKTSADSSLTGSIPENVECHLPVAHRLVRPVTSEDPRGDMHIMDQSRRVSTAALISEEPYKCILRNARIKITLRRPFPDELQWFQTVPHIAGYAADDNQVVLNPYSSLTQSQRACVLRNELLRVFMRTLAITPDIELLPSQIDAFRKTVYATDEDALRQTIIARIASGDASGGQASDHQVAFAHALSELFDEFAEIASTHVADHLLLRASARVKPCSRA